MADARRWPRRRHRRHPDRPDRPAHLGTWITCSPLLTQRARGGGAPYCLATQQVHARVGGWNRTTVRHALRELIREGRVGFSGRDRHRRYLRSGGTPVPPPPPVLPPAAAAPTKPPPSWHDYGQRGDGSVRLPEERQIATAMRRHRIRYRDVGDAELLAEERMPGWSWRKRSNAELTRIVFGDPPPGRRPLPPPRPYPARRAP